MVRQTDTKFDFNRFSDDIARRQSSGMPLDVEEYVAQFPDHETEIRDAFPVLCMLSQQASESPANDNTPEHINGYQIVREIGRGGMGIVYEATHPKLTRRMAIKVLTPAQAGKSSLQERFAREAEAASRLSHPHIVPLFDFGESDGQSFLVMPFIRGRGLDEILNEYWSSDAAGRAPVGQPALPGRSIAPVAMIASDFRRIAALGASVAAALVHAHEQQTIHRDIKPANLLLDENRKVWVTDFGLAKLRDENSDLSLTGDIIGTPRYMAPEQIRGQSDERSDIYSLGVTLWELASGTRAWHAVNKGDMLSVKSAFDLPPIREINRDVPPDLAAIISRCCAFHPRDRYQTAAQVQQTLNRFAHDGIASDRRFGPAAVARAASSRYFLGTMLACLIALSVVLIYSRRSLPAGPALEPSATTISSRPPAICGPQHVSLAVAPGQTSFPDFYLTAADPDHDRFSWVPAQAVATDLLIVQKLSGHLCLPQPFAVSSDLLDGGLSVRATDELQPHVALFTADHRQQILWNGTPDETWLPTTLPHGLLAVWSEDGIHFEHVHLSNDGTVVLYESVRDQNQWHTTLLQPDTKLMPTLRGLTRHGDEFLSLEQTREGVVLQWLTRSDDHQFCRMGSAIALPAGWQADGISCLGQFDFQLATRGTDGTNHPIRFAEIAVNHQRVLGLRELPTGWSVPSGRIVGLAAWTTANATRLRIPTADDSATVHITFAASSGPQATAAEN